MQNHCFQAHKVSIRHCFQRYKISVSLISCETSSTQDTLYEPHPLKTSLLTPVRVCNLIKVIAPRKWKSYLGFISLSLSELKKKRNSSVCIGTATKTFRRFQTIETRKELTLQLLPYRNILSYLSCISAIQLKWVLCNCDVTRLSFQSRVTCFVVLA